MKVAHQFTGTSIAQLAYHVPDVEQAARDCAALFGWGPFFVLRHIALTRCSYRGRLAEFDHSSAYGQAGPVMIELLQQHNDGPSAVRDMYGPDDAGIHHAAAFAPDMGAELARYEKAGFPVALHARTAVGIEFAMIDTRPLFGHMLELYPPSAALTSFYAMVRQAAMDWDGDEPVRVIG